MAKLLQSDGARRLAPPFAAALIRGLERSCRWTLEIDPFFEEHVAAKKGAIGAFWHNRMLMIPLIWRRILAHVGRDPNDVGYTLSGHHKDASLMVEIIGRLGVKAVRGSSTRGGADALRNMQKVVESGAGMSIAVDGPTGPRYEAHMGVLQLARQTGAPIAPLTFAAKRRFLANTWDRLVVPLPFTEGVLKVGAPIAPPTGRGKAALLEAKADLDQRLRALTDETDARYGHEAIEPGYRRRSRKDAQRDGDAAS